MTFSLFYDIELKSNFTVVKKILLLHFIALSILVVACKKDTKPTDEPLPPAPTDYATKEVQVVLPKPGIDLSTCMALSYSTTAALNSQGKVRVAYEPGSSTIAYILDANNNLLMAGFITDSTAVINTQSTAKVLLYYAYQVPLQPYPITPYFINHIHEVQGVSGWYKEFDSLFSKDPLIVSNGNFAAPLKKTIETLIKNNNVDIRANKAADITVDNGDVRSGLQVTSETLSQFSVIHTYRRRAHGFLYKKSYKDLNGNLTNIPNYDANGEDFAVDPVSAVSSLTGEAGKIIEGTLNESASSTFGPYPMELASNETEATYVLRIIGPGFGGTGRETKTKAETDRLTQLQLETFALDFFLPVIMEIAGNKEAINKKGVKIGDGPTEQFIKSAEVFLKAFPDVNEEVKQGNFVGAVKAGVVSLLTNAGQVHLENCILAATGIMYASATKAGVKVPNLTFNRAKDLIASPLAVLKVVEFALFSTDLLRITANITWSHQMEEWVLTARGGSVDLTPKQKSVIPYQQAKLTAIIKNFKAPDDTHPYFEWKTTGKFGKLTDTKGHTDMAEFSSADADVFYVSRSSNSSLSDGDNIDYIYVTAYYGTTKIASDTVKINVQKDRYKITPEGLTVSGKKGASNELTLYLEKTQGYNGISANDSIDYKVVWTTAGSYGKLSGRETYTQASVTQYNDNWIIYECLNDQVKEATETIRAKIYRKRKAEPESAYLLFDEAEGTVKINNDPKKKIVVIPFTFYETILTPSVGNWALYSVVKIPLVDTTLKYSVKAFNYTGTAGTVYEGRVYSWNAGQVPPGDYPLFSTTFGVDSGSVYLSTGRTWCGGPCDYGTSVAQWKARSIELWGHPLAEVTYYLK